MDTKELIIMRHAKSDWQNEAISDIDRPLNQRGLRDAPHMAQWMADQGLCPDQLISSPALRASQTTSEVARHVNIDEDHIVYDKRMYLANINTLLAIIADTNTSFNSIMLVGHNPGLENLCLELSKDEIPRAADGAIMTTANIIHLRTNQDWDKLSQSSCDLIQVMRPKELP